MKLPRRRRKPVPELAEPASAGPVLQVLIYSRTGLPGPEFSAQTDKLRPIASYDDATRSWYDAAMWTAATDWHQRMG